MNREELRQLEGRFSELADYYGTKKPTASALSVWKDVLEGQRWDDIAGVLTDWPKHKRAFPTGEEVRKLSAERVSSRLEEQSKRDSANSPDIADVIAAAPDTPSARAFRRMWGALNARKVGSPREWCENVLASDKADGELKAFAAASLEQMPSKGAQGGHGPKAWACRLKAKEAAGVALSIHQQRLWREALREEEAE